VTTLSLKKTLERPWWLSSKRERTVLGSYIDSASAWPKRDSAQEDQSFYYAGSEVFRSLPSQLLCVSRPAKQMVALTSHSKP